MNNPAEQDELAWLAFQYLAGEFTAADAESFEQRLATDQVAREAVAEAVALFHAVCVAEATAPVVAKQPDRVLPAKNPLQTLVWRAVIAIAAAVLLALTLNLDPFADRSPNVASSSALADAWSAVRSDFASDEQPAPSVSADGILTDAELALAEDDLAMSTEAPSWMTAAVLGLAGKQPLDSGEPMPQEN